MLDLFDGQLSLDDIKNSTYKELNYMRKHRTDLLSKRAKEGNLSAVKSLLK